MVFWVLQHGILWLVSGGVITRLSPRAALVFAGFTAWIGYIDAKRRNELLFLGNLGIRPASIPGIWFLTAILLESLLAFTMMTVGR
ncbi:MAG TPA: hypothetical protein VK544_04255 [Gemmatimonadaceae bacterium]|nr:hypothetical protein [Gemmatimonadaceae bacterium]